MVLGMSRFCCWRERWLRRLVAPGPVLSRWGPAVLDSAVWAAGCAAAAWYGVGLFSCVAAGWSAMAAGAAAGLYGWPRRFRFGGVADAARCGWALAASAAVAAATGAGSMSLVAPVVAAGGLAAVRVGWRAGSDWARTGLAGPSRRVVVVGAGVGGRQLAAAVAADPAPPFVVAAFVDDDPAKADLEVNGASVRGRVADLAAVAARCRASTVVVAVPSASSTLLASVAERAADAGLDLLVAPSLTELRAPGAPLSPGTVRPPTVTDLTGRHQVVTDADQSAAYLTGRRVMITGAGGSIGSEIARRVAAFGPALLVLADRDETTVTRAGFGLAGPPVLEVFDVRDRPAVDAVMAVHRPEVVFHAAALKHVPLLEACPAEAVLTNVAGTSNVAEASAAVGATLVNVSTDKAADPVSVLGASKALGERVVAAVAAAGGPPAVSVRFGNVAGSRGSVLEVWASQIEAGGPVTVTDPDATRFLMTVGEAVELVVYAGAHAAAGGVLVLDVGAPVRVGDLAARMMEVAGRVVPIRVTGLRPGEKLHETLWAAHEAAVEGPHPLIRRVAVTSACPDVAGLLIDRDPVGVRRRLLTAATAPYRSSR